MQKLCLGNSENFVVLALSLAFSLLFVCMSLRALGMLCFIFHNRHFTFARDLSRDLGEYPAFLGPLEHQVSLLGGQVNLITGQRGFLPQQHGSLSQVIRVLCTIRTLKTISWNVEVARKGFTRARMSPHKTVNFWAVAIIVFLHLYIL